MQIFYDKEKDMVTIDGRQITGRVLRTLTGQIPHDHPFRIYTSRAVCRGQEVVDIESFTTSSSTVEVLRERTRQLEEEAHDADHDAQHPPGDLARAAAAYVISGCRFLKGYGALALPPFPWPESWGRLWFKPKSATRDFVRAGALMLAELDRLDADQAKAAEEKTTAVWSGSDIVGYETVPAPGGDDVDR